METLLNALAVASLIAMMAIGVFLADAYIFGPDAYFGGLR